MTPHEMMDLPYYGDAEVVLRRQGDWESSDVEAAESRLFKLEEALTEIVEIGEYAL